MKAFHQAQNELGIQKRSFSLPVDRFDPLKIKGVSVSVNIDLILKRTVCNEDRIGGVILRLTRPVEAERAVEKRKEAADYVAALIFMQMSEQKNISGKADATICLAYDIQQRIVGEIKSRSKRIKDIESACQMICAVWPSV